MFFDLPIDLQFKTERVVLKLELLLNTNANMHGLRKIVSFDIKIKYALTT
jgi:hypothetical protein